jgi:hypothetical protein
MEKDLFIGIDFSKDKFDVSVMHLTYVGACVYHCFDNTKEGCKESGQPHQKNLN